MFMFDCPFCVKGHSYMKCDRDIVCVNQKARVGVSEKRMPFDQPAEIIPIQKKKKFQSRNIWGQSTEPAVQSNKANAGCIVMDHSSRQGLQDEACWYKPVIHSCFCIQSG